MKDGFITGMLLGLFLLAGIWTFGVTVADDIVVHNKIQNLKKLTDHSALAAAKHYIINDDTADAETMVRNMLDKTELGSEVRDSITFEWDLVSDPRTVKSIITNYSQGTFWYRFLNKDNFVLDAESMANIIGDEEDVAVQNELKIMAMNIIHKTTKLLIDDSRDEIILKFDNYSRSL